MIASMALLWACKEPDVDAAGDPSVGPPASADAPVASLSVPGAPAGQHVLPDGRTVYVTMATFVGSSLSKAPGPLYLHVRGVHIEPGSAAELYVGSQVPNGFDDRDYIGSIATVVGNPTELPEVVLEVNDFTVEGKAFTARSTLRDNTPYFALAWVVTQGSMTVDSFELSTAP